MSRLRLAIACLLLVATTLSAEESDETLQQIDEIEISDFDREHWAYLPIIRPPIPDSDGDGDDWSNSDIDRLILAELQRQSLQPAGRAGRAALLRRLHLDLTGLPPTPDVLHRFIGDSRPDAYRREVDWLLASPQYGQRWAQPWLDLARFAETDGFEHDKPRPTAWQYRDWVIAAWNDDMPYDQFVRWQLAGDVLAPQDPRATIATAFCLSGPDMPDINSQQERRHVLLNDITSTVGAVFLALQVGCAQCHDHKFDAISQADFYRLRAFFDPAIELQRNQSVTVLTSAANDQASRLMVRGDWRRPGPLLQPGLPRVLVAVESNPVPPDPGHPRAALAQWLTDRDHPLTARVIANRIWQYHFGRGLCQTPNDFGVLNDPPTHPELLDYLADELIRGQWSLKRLHRQIVLSSVYQTRSTRPTATDQIAAWDASLHQDPDNQLLSRFPRQRMQAEVIRDSLFAVSGSLNHQLGGPGVSPPLPAEMVQTLKSGQWQSSERVADHYRRSVYIFARRNLTYPMFATFDRPAALDSCPGRNRSTTAVQSLSLLNSAITIDAANRLAAVLQRHHTDTIGQITDLYHRVYGRSPTPQETAQCESFLANQQTLIADTDPEAAPDAALADLCRALLNSNEFIYVD